jgi:hypothetical protein
MNAFEREKYLVSMLAKITIKSLEKYFFSLDFPKKKDMFKRQNNEFL